MALITSNCGRHAQVALVTFMTVFKVFKYMNLSPRLNFMWKIVRKPPPAICPFGSLGACGNVRDGDDGGSLAI